MKILLAGASGVVGRVLLPQLIEQGHEVVAVSRTAPVIPSSEIRDGMRWRGLDILDRESVFQILSEERPNCVIHQLTDLKARDLAANSRIRILGTRHLVDAAKSAEVQRIVAQSIAWIYEPGTEPATESTPLDVQAQPPRATTVQGVIALESAVAEIPEHVVLRYGIFYGPGTWYDREGSFANQVRGAQVVSTNQITNFVHVSDAARAALLALHWPVGVVNVVDGDAAPETDWLPIYARWLGASVPSAASDPAPIPLRPVSNKRALNLGWFPQHTSWRQEFSRPN